MSESKQMDWYKFVGVLVFQGEIDDDITMIDVSADVLAYSLEQALIEGCQCLSPDDSRIPKHIGWYWDANHAVKVGTHEDYMKIHGVDGSGPSPLQIQLII
jgi:hypothetical protein